jgi:hypothetical protein
MKIRKAALSIHYDPAKLIGSQYSVQIFYAEQEPTDRAEMLASLSEHLNHVVNALTAMMNTAIRDFGIDKRGLYNELVNYLTNVRDSGEFIEFHPPIVNNERRRSYSPVEIQILFNPYKPLHEQYEMVHETYLEKPKTKNDVLIVLASDICHIANGLVFLLNKIISDHNQNRVDIYNQVVHQVLLIRGFGIELTKEMPNFEKNKNR